MKWTPILAMVLIAALEAIALSQGMNGTALSLSVGAVAGLGGYQLKKRLDNGKGGG